MIIDCISDLHGELVDLPGGDMLIVAGDITASDKVHQWKSFFGWFKLQDYEKKILVAGNHDRFLEQCCTYEEAKSLNLDDEDINPLFAFDYLCDSGTEFQGLKIWGSPWTNFFWGMNPDCMAFTCKSEKDLYDKWLLIPHDVDILITHSPSWGILDKTNTNEHVGNVSLRLHTPTLPKLKLHVFGHIHECGGKVINATTCKFVNASIMNENYEAVNKSIRIIL